MLVFTFRAICGFADFILTPVLLYHSNDHPRMTTMLLLLRNLLLLLPLFVATGRAEEPIQVVLLAGQSNMDGHGDSAKLPAELRAPPANVTFIHRGVETPLGAGKTFGPEVGFAAAVAAARPAQRFLLIKHAIGGTSLAGWAPKWDKERPGITKYDLGAGPLYRTLMNQVAAATKGKTVRFTAVLWMQGESDTRYPALGPKYFENHSELIAALRTELKQPALPFLFGHVNPPTDAKGEDGGPRYPFLPQVRAAQERTAKEVPGTALIETDDLTKNADRLHYDTAGQVELGRRFAKAWLAAVAER